MKLYQNTLSGLRYRCWTKTEALAYFVKGAARELNVGAEKALRFYQWVVIRQFTRKWLKSADGTAYFDFCGAKLPDVSNDRGKMMTLKFVFEDVFLLPCYFKDDHSKKIVEKLDPFMEEGPYGYVDGVFNVTVGKKDTVVDVGAWIGDFAAYAASKGATVFAFEPVKQTFELLKQTCSLNNVNGGAKSYLFKKHWGIIRRKSKYLSLMTREEVIQSSFITKE